MRVKPQTCLLPAVLFAFLFFSAAAYPQKKNNSQSKSTVKGANFYNKGYDKSGADKGRDIISSNKKSSSYDDRNDRYVWYVVKSGDTLYSIAKRSETSVEKIQELNSLEKSSIYKGMKLKIPSSGKQVCGNIKEQVSSAGNENKPLFLWPVKKVKGYSSDGKYGVKSIGIIIRANPGSEVIASEKGVVKKVGYMRGYGKYIVVNHGNRYITVYSNLMDIDVKAGDSVSRGGRIGNISDDMKLHFQIDRAGKPENPLDLLPVRS